MFCDGRKDRAQNHKPPSFLRSKSGGSWVASTRSDTSRCAHPLDGRFVMMPSDTHYLTVEDVATRFGVNVTTVYRLVKEGRLPAFKVGNQWRFREERLEEWVADRERVG